MQNSAHVLASMLVAFLLLLGSQGCVSGYARQSSAATAAPGTTLFSDDFSDRYSGWGSRAQGGAKVEYDKGGLRIQVGEKQHDSWSVAGKNFKDVQIEVDATRLDGPEDNVFGIVCRYLDQDNFYMLIVTSDGYYGIARVKDGEYSMIGSDQLQYTGSAIHRGAASNHLRADCVGSTLRLYANGQVLMEAQDTDFTSGDVGLLAGAYLTPGVDILFDDFVVKRP